MTDPLDTPPEDHGSDRYDAVVLVGAPEGVEPEPALVDWYDRHGCLDCNPNFFYHWRPESPSKWFVVIAHDETCPSLTKREQEGTAQNSLTVMPREQMDQVLGIAREHDPDVIGVVILHGSPVRSLAMSAWSTFEGEDANQRLYWMIRVAFQGDEETP